MANEEIVIAKLNEVTDLLSALSGGRLREIVRPSSRFEQAAGCTGNCDCRGGYCGCNASVTASVDPTVQDQAARRTMRPVQGKA